MFKFRDKEYSNATEALDDYIRDFEMRNHETEKMIAKLLLTKNEYYNKNKQNSSHESILKSSSSDTYKTAPPLPTSAPPPIPNISITMPTTIVDPLNTEKAVQPDDIAIKKIENLINILSKRINEHKKQTDDSFIIEPDAVETKANNIKNANQIELTPIQSQCVSPLPALTAMSNITQQFSLNVKPIEINFKEFNNQISENIDKTERTNESIKEKLVIFENINKKFNESNNKKLQQYNSNDSIYSTKLISTTSATTITTPMLSSAVSSTPTSVLSIASSASSTLSSSSSCSSQSTTRPATCISTSYKTNFINECLKIIDDDKFHTTKNHGSSDNINNLQKHKLAFLNDLKMADEHKNISTKDPNLFNDSGIDNLLNEIKESFK